MNEKWLEILGAIHAADNSEAVLPFLRSVDEHGEDARWRILSASLERLQELQYDDFEGELLQQCICRSDYEGHFVHSQLNRWLSQQPATKRAEVIGWLIGKLDEGDLSIVENSLWTLVTIGFRDALLEQRLVVLINAPPSERTQLVALWSLVWMGYPDIQFLEASVLQWLNQQSDVPELATRCGRMLTSRKLLPAYFQLLDGISDSVGMPMFGSDLLTNLLYVLADTAEAHPDVTAEIWAKIASRGEVLVEPLSFHGGILEKVDDICVPDYILHALQPAPPEDFREGRFASPHYHNYLMLNSLNGKNQLGGLHSTLDRASMSTKERVLSVLKADATLDTRNMGAYETSLSHLKDICWDVVLRLNLDQTAQWITEALKNETGPFAAADLCRLSGYLRVKEATEKLESWAVQEGWDQQDGLPIILGLAVIDALGNIGTSEAFATLTKSQVSFAGRYADRGIADTTPRSYGDAFTACLMSEDAVTNAESLILQLERGPAEHPRCWISCAAALRNIAGTKRELVEPYQKRIYALLDRDDIVQSEFLHFLVAAIRFFDADEHVEHLLMNWARSTEHQALDATAALAHWRCLQSHSDLLVKIGLNQDDGGSWHISRTLDYREAFIVGLLFMHDQKLFTPPLLELIEKGSHREAVQVLQVLTKENTSSAILEALVARAHALNQPFRAEGAVLRVLSEVDPARFVQEFRYEVTASWHAAAREAVVYYSEDLDASLGSDIMAAFLDDPVYVVRRAAARNLAQKNVGRLRDAIASLCTEIEPEARVRGIEAAVWLDEEAFTILYQNARHDREEKVRSAAREAERDRRRVDCSRDYLRKVLAAPDDGILSAWHYGEALQKIGDDEVVHLLQEAMETAECLPNKRAYLNKLREKVEKEWDEWEKKRKDRLSD